MDALKSVSVVLYNVKHPELFFATASVIKARESMGNPVIILPATAALLGDESQLMQSIASALYYPEEIFWDESAQTYNDDILAYEDEDEEDDVDYDDVDYDDEDDFDDAGNEFTEEELREIIPEKIRFCLLDIGPKNDADMQSLVSFFDRHEDEVLLWVNNSHDWFQNELHYINYYQELLKWNRDKSILELMTAQNYPISPDWLAAEKVLTHITRQGLQTNPLAKRYYQAICVSVVESSNFQDNSALNAFMAIASECADREPNILVEELNEQYEDMKKITARSIGKIETNVSFLRHLNKINRPAGYLNLGRTPDYTEINEILERGAQLYPWLFVLVYKFDYDGLERIEAVSIKLQDSLERIAFDCDERLDKAQILRQLARKVRQAKPALTLIDEISKAPSP